MLDSELAREKQSSSGGIRIRLRKIPYTDMQPLCFKCLHVPVDEKGNRKSLIKDS